jgi:hypothetical protein
LNKILFAHRLAPTQPSFASLQRKVPESSHGCVRSMAIRARQELAEKISHSGS